MYTTLGHTLASTMVAAPSSRTSFSTTQPPTLPTAERCQPAISFPDHVDILTARRSSSLTFHLAIPFNI